MYARLAGATPGVTPASLGLFFKDASFGSPPGGQARAYSPIIDDTPNSRGGHVGSAYQTGWYGYARKDLRRVLGLEVRSPYSERYCGGGRRARCRAALREALARALQVDPATLYRDATCAEAGRPGDQACYDAIAFRATGGVTQPMIGWQNRPTYQLAVEVQGHRPR